MAGDNITQRSIEVFPNAYATLLSTVLGIALAIVADSVVFAVDKHSGTELAVWLAEAFTTVFAVLIVFYNYIWFLLLFRWAPGFFDSAIPLVLGASAVALAAAVGHHIIWLWMLTALQTVALLSFGHTKMRSKVLMFDNQMIFLS